MQFSSAAIFNNKKCAGESTLKYNIETPSRNGRQPNRFCYPVAPTGFVSRARVGEQINIHSYFIFDNIFCQDLQNVDFWRFIAIIRHMNNLFLEGPVQTGKSTLIREILHEAFGPELSGIGGFTVQRMHFPTRGDEKRFGFRLMPASAPIAAHTCVTTTDENLISSDGVFKLVGPDGSLVNTEVFETAGVSYLKSSINDANSSRISIVLLDEIGGHEMVCDEFREILYNLLDSEVPCLGVIKMYESAAKMARRDSRIADFNKELHKKITGPSDEHGEILYFERGDESVRKALSDFVKSSSR